MTALPSVLFVCLGNICRSPLAEAAFRSAANKANLQVVTDSAGTAPYHVGQPPDPRSIEIAKLKGIDISGYRGRQLKQDDFNTFNFIFAMDEQNLSDIKHLAPPITNARISLLLDVLPARMGQNIEDPYYGGKNGFDRTWNEVSEAAQAFVLQLKAAV